MNGDELNPCVIGVEGMVGIYRQTLPHISLSGPTNFAGVLERFERITLAGKYSKIY